MTNLKLIIGIFILLIISSCAKPDTIPAKVDLISTVWKLKYLELELGKEFPQKDYILNFTSDSTFTINLYVNNCDGKYGIQPFVDSKSGDIHIDPISCTKICCDNDYSIQLINIIQSASQYSFTGNNLSLDATVDKAIFTQVD